MRLGETVEYDFRRDYVPEDALEVALMPDDQMPVCLIPMREILCTNATCGLRIKHSISAIKQMLQFLPESAAALQQIPYVCPVCKHLQMADVSSSTVQANPDEQPLTSGKTEYLVLLECTEGDCPHRIQALVTMERRIEIFQVEEQMRDWSNDGAQCPLNHRLRHPFALRAVADLAAI